MWTQSGTGPRSTKSTTTASPSPPSAAWSARPRATLNQRGLKRERSDSAAGWPQEVQGGPFTEEEAAEFIEKEGAKDAVVLRLWDDKGKARGVETVPLEYFKQYVVQAVR